MFLDRDFPNYHGHSDIYKYYLAPDSTSPIVEHVSDNANVEELKSWIRPSGTVEKGQSNREINPHFRILMIKTENRSFRNAGSRISKRDDQLKAIINFFRHSDLPLAALKSYGKSRFAFNNSSPDEVLNHIKFNNDLNKSYYCSCNSLLIAWMYFSETK